MSMGTLIIRQQTCHQICVTGDQHVQFWYFVCVFFLCYVNSSACRMDQLPCIPAGQTKYTSALRYGSGWYNFQLILWKKNSLLYITQWNFGADEKMYQSCMIYIYIEIEGELMTVMSIMCEHLVNSAHRMLVHRNICDTVQTNSGWAVNINFDQK